MAGSYKKEMYKVKLRVVATVLLLAGKMHDELLRYRNFQLVKASSLGAITQPPLSLGDNEATRLQVTQCATCSDITKKQ